VSVAPSGSALHRVSTRQKLRGEVILDNSGQLRRILRTPNWENYVQVACSEIRARGADYLQVARRMRAVLESLLRTLPEYRCATLNTVLELLDWAIQSLFSRPEELARARLPDFQGLGGSMGARRG
jgi:uncharacterized membrane protein